MKKEFLQPLALEIAQKKQALSRPLIYGILGSQGTGKTTICKRLVEILAELGQKAVAVYFN